MGMGLGSAKKVICLKAMNLTDFQQVVNLPTSAMDVYTILLDERRHSSFTGDFVHIEDVEGTPISLYDGLVVGKNIVLERGYKIIWSFIYAKPGWPEGHESEAAIVITDTDSGECRLELFHTAVPVLFKEELQQFWNENYWEPLQYYIAR